MEESCYAERRLHRSLMEDPGREVSEKELQDLADPDTRDNYRILLGFRRKLLEAGTVEGCYRDLFRAGSIEAPALFLGQLAHVIVRNVLEGCDDPLQLRAAELFFREQKASLRDGQVLVADLETVDSYAAGSRYGSMGRLIVEAQGSLGKADLDVLDRANAALYWERESRYDTAISLTYGRAALEALCRVIEAWVAHFFGTRIAVTPLRKIEETRWAWHIGLDAESTAILNDLWNGNPVDAGRMRRVLALFRMDFAQPGDMRQDIAGRPAYLALSADADDVVRLKPQNLLMNLPIHEA